MEPSALIAAMRARVEGDGVLDAAADVAPYLTDWRRRHQGAAACVVKPRSTREVSAVLSFADAHRVPVFPQGGNTSVCGGSVPSAGGNGIVLGMGRMNRVLDANPGNNSIVVEAGCVLQQVQKAARAVDRLFPLSLGAEGSCQIGGNLATNAGGTSVLRYGNMRDLVLGIEVVLPDGRVLDMLRTLRKDNSGYDLKNLFVGSEGTLGVITAAALKLFPLPRHFVTAMLVAGSANAAVQMALTLQDRFQGELTALEIISQSEFEIVMRHAANVIPPFTLSAPWYLLAELGTHDDDADAAARLEATLADGLERRLIDDAVVALSEEQRQNLWRIRHSVTEANMREGMGLTHDIAVPVVHVPRFLVDAASTVERAYPQARVVVVGHVGDGNLHYIVMFSHEEWAALADKPRLQHDLARTLYEIAASLGGTFSAEHGIGALHLPEMARFKSRVELDVMRAVKRTLDPNGIMNPQRVLPAT